MPLVNYELDRQSIATITLNRDDKRNALSQEMADQLLQVLARTEFRAVNTYLLALRVLVARGELTQEQLVAAQTSLRGALGTGIGGAAIGGGAVGTADVGRRDAVVGDCDGTRVDGCGECACTKDFASLGILRPR